MSTHKLRFDETGMYEGSEQLTTFRAKIVRETEIYKRDRCVGRQLTIELRMQGRSPRRFEIDATELNKKEWVAREVGVPEAVCLVSRQRVAEAMIALSAEDKQLVRRCLSMGFQTVDGKPAYVHGGGVLAPSGTTLDNMEARPGHAFSGYGFPDPSTDKGNRADYLKAPLRLLRLSKVNLAIGAVLLGSAIRSVLSEFHPSVVTPILIGETGAGKSEMLALATSFFRPGTDVNSLPFNMVSTAIGLRVPAQASAHTLFPIDDYYPTQGKRSANDDFVEMLILGGSTTAARLTAKSATESAPAEAIRTLVMLTAEVALVTDKESRHARALYCEVGKHDVDAERRVACIEHARSGDFGRAMREFIVACLSRHELFKVSVPKRFEYYQRKAGKALPELHRRQWLNVADIMLGVHYYLRFCHEEGIVDGERYKSLLGRSWKALVGLAKTQPTLIQRYSQDGVVGRAFENLLKDGKYHLLQVGPDDSPNGVPADRVGSLDGDPRGKLLGYVDAVAQKLYVPTNIDDQALYDALPRDAQKLLARGSTQLWKRLAGHGLVEPREEGRNASKVSRLGSGRFYRLTIPGLFQ